MRDLLAVWFFGVCITALAVLGLYSAFMYCGPYTKDSANDTGVKQP